MPAGPAHARLIAPDDETASDLRKQIITVISTLLVAVVSFYFGSRTVASARDIVRRNDSNVPDPVIPDPVIPDSNNPDPNKPE